MQNRRLRYGDTILLSFNGLENQYYLCARSKIGRKCKIVSENRDLHPLLEGVTLALYPNTHELLFKVLPEQQFNSIKEFTTIHPEDPRYSIIQKRYEIEKDMNERIVKKMEGELVRFGDSIQLYHEVSQAFVACSDEQYYFKGVYSVLLSHSTSMFTHFTINPRGSMKTTGNVIAYTDRVGFICSFNKNALCCIEKGNKAFKYVSNFNEFKFKLKFTKKYESYESGKDELPTISRLPMVEFVELYDIEDALCMQVNTENGLKLENYDNMSFDISLIHIRNTRQSTRKEVRYGDFIRIREGIKNLQTDGFLICEVNYSGSETFIQYRDYARGEKATDMCFSSIFQVIPSDINIWGTDVIFGNNNSLGIVLRHYLTGRMVNMPVAAEGLCFDDLIPTLSETFEEFLKVWLSEASNIKKIETEFKKSIAHLDSMTQVQMTKANLKKEITKNCINAYFAKYSFEITNDIHSDDARLTNDILLRISRSEKLGLRINEDEEFHTCFKEKMCLYYDDCFHLLSAKLFKSFIVTLHRKDNSSLFKFDDIIEEDLSHVNHFVELILPLVNILKTGEYSNDDLFSAEKNIRELGYLLKDKSAEANGDLILQSRIQDAYRDLSIIDICVRFLYTYLFCGLKGNEKIERLVNLIANFLQLTCKSNESNRCYLYQWSKLYIDILLDLGWEDKKDEIPCRITLDDLINTILEDRQFNDILAKDALPKVLDDIEFEKLEIKKLSLLVNILNTGEDNNREDNIFELIKSMILYSTNFNKLLRPLSRVDQEGNILSLERAVNLEGRQGVAVRFEDRLIRIDNGDASAEFIEYLTSSIKLARVISQGHGSIFEVRYRQIMTHDICVDIITSPNIDPRFRAEVLLFFMDCYMEIHTSYLQELKIPELVWFDTIEQKKELNALVDNKRNRIINNLFLKIDSEVQELPIESVTLIRSSKGRFRGLIPYLLEYISSSDVIFNMEKYATFFLAIIKVIRFIIRKNIFTRNQLMMLKFNLFSFLKNKLVSRPKLDRDRIQFSADELRLIGSVSSCMMYLEEISLNAKLSILMEDEEEQEAKRILFDNSYVDREKVLETKVNKKIVLNRAAKILHCSSKKAENSTYYLLELAAETDFKMKEILDTRLIERKRYFFNLGKDIAGDNSHYCYLMLELMKLGDMKISQEALEILINIFQMRRFFMGQIPYLQVIFQDGIIEVLYTRYSKSYNIINDAIKKIRKSSQQKSSMKEIGRLYEDINRNLNEIIKDSIFPITEVESSQLFAKKLQARYTLCVGNIEELTVNSRPGCFINMFNEYFIDLSHYDLKQVLMKNIGYIDTLFDLLETLNSVQLPNKSIGIGIDFFCEEYRLVEPDEKITDSLLLMRELGIKCILILSYCCFNNPITQEYLKSKLLQKDTLSRFFNFFFLGEKQIISKYFISFLIGLYANNLSMLLSIDAHDDPIISIIVSTFFRCFPGDEANYNDYKGVPEICLSLFTSLRAFIFYKGLKIYKNQELIIDIIRNQSDKVKITKFFNTILKKVIKKTSYETERLKGRAPLGLKISPEIPTDLVKIPVEISFAIQFLGLISDCSKKLTYSQLIDLQLILPIRIIKKLLISLNGKWHFLSTELYRFITSIYLIDIIEQDDWVEICSLIIDSTIDTLEETQTLAYGSKQEKKIVFFEELRSLCSFEVSYDTNYRFIDYHSSDLESSLRSLIFTGLIKFLNRFMNLMLEGTVQVDRSFILMFKKKISSNETKKNVLFNTLYKSRKIEGFEMKIDDEEGLKYELEHNRFARDEDDVNHIEAEVSNMIIDLAITLERRIGSSRRMFKGDNDFFFSFSVPDMNELLRSSYYSYSIDVPFERGRNIEDVSHYKQLFKFYSDYMGYKYYNDIFEEDKRSFLELFFGLDAQDKRVIFHMLLSILEYEFNEKSHKMNALMILRLFVDFGRENRIGITMMLIENSIIEILCKTMIKYSHDYDFIPQLIDLLVSILEEEEEVIQARMFEYLDEVDKNNQFMNSIQRYLNILYLSFDNSESLRREVIQSLSSNSESDRHVIEVESDKYIDRLCRCIEMLRLMCENHFSVMQNYMREQSETNSKLIRANSVNMINEIIQMLIKYQNVMDEFNRRLGEKIFEFFIEILQGPCVANQIEICNSKLMDTVEGIIVVIIQDSKKLGIPHSNDQASISVMSTDQATDNQSDNQSEEGEDQIKSKREELFNKHAALSKIVDNIVTFMMAVIEATTDQDVISKMTIHTHQDVFLSRIRDIYLMFAEDISQRKQKISLQKWWRKLKGHQVENDDVEDVNGNNEVSKNFFSILVEDEGLDDRKFNPIIMEGIKLVILLKSLADISSEFSENLSNSLEQFKSRDDKFSKYYQFFVERVDCIEIVNPIGELQTVYFPRHQITDLLTLNTMNKFDKEIPRDNPNEKLRGLLNSFPHFYREMQHNHKLRSRGLNIDPAIFGILKMVTFIIVVIANFIELFSNPKPEPYIEVSVLAIWVYSFILLVCIIYLILFILWAIFYAKLDYTRYFEQSKNKFEALSKIKNNLVRPLKLIVFSVRFYYSIAIGSYFLDLIMNLVFAMLGFFFTRIFFAVLLLDAIGRSELLINVVRAITLNAKQLMMTAILGFIVIFIFASIAEYTDLRITTIYVQEFDFKMCENFLQCFITTLGFGLRAGGGIGDSIKYPDYGTERFQYIQRFCYDYLFFALVILIYFNILSGGIIDTFGDLREKKTSDGIRLFNHFRFRQKI